MEKIKGIIYDLDGTLISTSQIHEAGWLYAGKKFGVPVSNGALFNQRGISARTAVKAMLPENQQSLAGDFIAAKAKYVAEHLNEASIFPGALETVGRLFREGCDVWICTSASGNFVGKIMDKFPELRNLLKENVVWREMYENEKPSSDALDLTMEKMGINNQQVVYVGDALSDYKTGLNAKVKFVYFCPGEKDPRIPDSIPVISSHDEIYGILGLIE